MVSGSIFFPAAPLVWLKRMLACLVTSENDTLGTATGSFGCEMRSSRPSGSTPAGSFLPPHPCPSSRAVPRAISPSAGMAHRARRCFMAALRSPAPGGAGEASLAMIGGVKDDRPRRTGGVAVLGLLQVTPAGTCLGQLVRLEDGVQLTVDGAQQVSRRQPQRAVALTAEELAHLLPHSDARRQHGRVIILLLPRRAQGLLQPECGINS